jgi:hypothetical protein
MWIMARTSTLQKFGYGLLVLYAGGIVALAVAVCADLPGLFRGRNGEDQRRAEMQNGRMLILSPDRGQCRSIRFNNETAQLSAETLTGSGRAVGRRLRRVPQRLRRPLNPLRSIGT